MKKKMQVNSPEYRALVSSLLGKQVVFDENLPKIKIEKNKPLLSGIRDVNLKILEDLNDEDLFSFCIVNKEANKLCDNENFWRNRFLKRFGQLYEKSEGRTWKNFYLTIIKEFAKELPYNDNLDKDLRKIRESFDLRKERYGIHDNGGRPFEVLVDENGVAVYKESTDDEFSHDESEDTDDPHYFNRPSFVFLNPEKVFVGLSPDNEMTRFSGGYGKEFDGNSILVNTEDNTYVYIGSEIYSFKSLSKIVEYVSPVGNSDVPYPYAVDINGNIYLMLEKIILLNGVGRLVGEDPYRYFYRREIVEEKIYYEEGDDESFYLSYTSDPEEFLERRGKIYVIDGKKKKHIEKEEFINIMRNYEEKMGFKPMKVFQLHDRMF